MGVESLRITYAKFHSSKNKFMSSELRKYRQKSNFDCSAVCTHRREELHIPGLEPIGTTFSWFGFSTFRLEPNMRKVNERGTKMEL